MILTPEDFLKQEDIPLEEFVKYNSMYPVNFEIITRFCQELHLSNKYREEYGILSKIQSFDDVEHRRNAILPFIVDEKLELNDIKDIVIKPFDNSLITFSITTCKRYDLFEQTMISFLKYCEDLHLIGRWIVVDDNSTDADREKMKTNFPFFEFVLKEYSQKGHAKSMNIIKNMVDTPFLFHMEDDWKFLCKKPYLSECLEILTSDPKYGQCLINKNYAETEHDIDIFGGVEKRTKFNTKFLEHNQHLEPLGKNCLYWNHYSLRPSLLRTSVFKTIGDYSETDSHFEAEYARRYIKEGLISVFLNGIYSLHIGKLTSEQNKDNAYTLNNETQFTPKEDSKKISCVVINLDRRPEKYKEFEEKCPKGLKIARVSGIDGHILKPSVDLCRLFAKNDYNMRKGIVGCALTHLILYKNFLNSPADYLCVFEDDIVFCDDFVPKFHSILPKLPDNFGIVYLGHHRRNKVAVSLNTNTTFIKKSTKESLEFSFGGTFCYIISKLGAQKMLDYVNTNTITNGIDTIQQKLADTVDVYYCDSPLITSEMNDVNSDIQHDFSSLSLTLLQKLKMEQEFYGKLTFCSVDETKFNVTEPTTYVVEVKKDLEFPDEWLVYNLESNIYLLTNVVDKRARVLTDMF